MASSWCFQDFKNQSPLSRDTGQCCELLGCLLAADLCCSVPAGFHRAVTCSLSLITQPCQSTFFESICPELVQAFNLAFDAHVTIPYSYMFVHYLFTLSVNSVRSAPGPVPRTEVSKPCPRPQAAQVCEAVDTMLWDRLGPSQPVVQPGQGKAWALWKHRRGC